tara:strand:+ start:1094 stop:1687 length:594 start_codon:yes stop_codon:yes gene_type:complete
MEQYDQQGIDALVNTGRPIPGQSLTTNPEERRPFEQAPEFVKFKDALDYTTAELLLEENYMPMMEAIADGVTIVDIATQMGYVGFREGKFNPDLMIMLIEPFMYLLMALAEKAGIEYRIDDEDDIDEDDTAFEQKTKNIANSIKEDVQKTGDIPQGALPTDVLEKIEALEMSSSLLAKEPQEMSETQPQSLLQRGTE